VRKSKKKIALIIIFLLITSGFLIPQSFVNPVKTRVVKTLTQNHIGTIHGVNLERTRE
jgi:hypothetical protein